MWSAGKLMRDVCLPKFPKVSVATADEIHNGNIPDDKDSKCYINCIMEMMQTVSRIEAGSALHTKDSFSHWQFVSKFDFGEVLEVYYLYRKGQM